MVFLVLLPLYAVLGCRCGFQFSLGWSPCLHTCSDVERGALDTATGNVVAATRVSPGSIGSINPALANLAEQQLGGVGATTPGVVAPVGFCAEFQAVNQLLNQGSVLEDIRLTDVIRPRIGDVVPKCGNCGI